MDDTVSLSDSRVVVTGGLGFIGSNLAIRLCDMGAEVTIIDNKYENGGANEFNITSIKDRVDCTIADIADYKDLELLIQDTDFIFDLAAQVSHLESMENPILDLNMNCASHLPLLEACRKSGRNPRLIYTGSRVQYGRIRRRTVTEKHPIEPVDNNGISKHTYEQYLMLYNRTYGLPATSLRLTNTYGPRHLMRHPRQGFVNWFVRLCIDREPIEIFGDGKQMREYTFVDDIVDACILSAEKETRGNCYNVGGYTGSVLRVAESLKKLRPETRIVFKLFPGERKPIEIGDYVSDYSKFHKATGWKPKIPLTEGLGRTLEYYERYKAHYW
jgi:nucleoside-diphosphate-sugar epimerase